MAAHPSAAADVLVVGGGPAGTAVVIPLARAGYRVTVVDRGDHPAGGSHVLTPKAVQSLDRLGVDHEPFHRVDRVRVTSGGSSNVTRWPIHGDDPRFARIASRRELAAMLLEASEEAGVKTLLGHTAISPIVERGFVRGARVVTPDATAFETRGTYTVIADGANSRFGRELGTYREPSWPSALAHVGTFRSALHAAPEIEIVPDLADRAGVAVTGFGWLFPNGPSTDADASCDVRDANANAETSLPKPVSPWVEEPDGAKTPPLPARLRRAWVSPTHRTPSWWKMRSMSGSPPSGSTPSMVISRAIWPTWRAATISA